MTSGYNRLTVSRQQKLIISYKIATKNQYFHRLFPQQAGTGRYNLIVSSKHQVVGLLISQLDITDQAERDNPEFIGLVLIRAGLMVERGKGFTLGFTLKDYCMGNLSTLSHMRLMSLLL